MFWLHYSVVVLRHFWNTVANRLSETVGNPHPRKERFKLRYELQLLSPK